MLCLSRDKSKLYWTKDSQQCRASYNYTKVKDIIGVLYGYPSITLVKASKAYPYLKSFYYNCFSVITKNRTIDFEMSKPNKLYQCLSVISYLSSNKSEDDTQPAGKKFFVYQRIKMILQVESESRQMSINELLIIGLIKLAKIQESEENIFKLYNILSKRFDISAKVMKVAKEIIGKSEQQNTAFRET